MSNTAHGESIQAVLFDYGLVLTGPPVPSAWERMKAILSAGETAFHAAYWAPRHDYDRGALNGNQYWHTVAQAVGRTLSSDELQALIAADTDLWTEPNQPMIDWAAQLQAAGIRTGILSNLGDAMELGVRERCPWLSDFHHHTFSHNLKTAKPDPAIYQHAANGLGVPPGAVLFIDDRADNIEAAQKAGMQVVQYTSHADFIAAMEKLGLSALLQPQSANAGIGH